MFRGSLRAAPLHAEGRPARGGARARQRLRPQGRVPARLRALRAGRARRAPARVRAAEGAAVRRGPVRRRAASGALPVLPRKIGVVTSLDGAAVRDIIQVLRRRYANAHIVIRPTRVQGEGAALEIARAIARHRQGARRGRGDRRPRRRLDRRSLGVQRRSGGAGDRRLRGADDLRGRPRDRRDDRRLRRRPARADAVGGRRAGGRPQGRRATRASTGCRSGSTRASGRGSTGSRRGCAASRARPGYGGLPRPRADARPARHRAARRSFATRWRRRLDAPGARVIARCAPRSTPSTAPPSRGGPWPAAGRHVGARRGRCRAAASGSKAAWAARRHASTASAPWPSSGAATPSAGTPTAPACCAARRRPRRAKRCGSRCTRASCAATSVRSSSPMEPAQRAPSLDVMSRLGLVASIFCRAARG